MLFFNASFSPKIMVFFIYNPRWSSVYGMEISYNFFLCQITCGLSSQALQLYLLSNGKEGIQIFLVYICFAKIEEVENGNKVFGLKAFELDQRVWMFVLLKHVLKERT